MKRLLASAAVVVALAGCTPATTTPVVTVTRPVFVVPDCMEEDGPGPCFWDAQARGNGLGTSFFIDATGETYYPAP